MKNFAKAIGVKVKEVAKAQKKKVVSLSLMASVSAYMAVPMFAAPATGDTDVDAMLTKFEAAFTTLKTAFWYIALAAIPVTLAVLAFFWIRGKVKQSVSGA